LKHLLLIPLLALLACCANSPAGKTTDVDKNIGWMQGNCLAIKNAGIQTPHKITLVKLEESNAVETGSIERKARSAEECFALLEDRREINASNGYSFYVVASSSPINLAIGLIEIDNASNMHADYCATSEGIRYSVLNGNSVVWQGYSYLGYDTEATCKDE